MPPPRHQPRRSKRGNRVSGPALPRPPGTGRRTRWRVARPSQRLDHPFVVSRIATERQAQLALCGIPARGHDLTRIRRAPMMGEGVQPLSQADTFAFAGRGLDVGDDLKPGMSALRRLLPLAETFDD